MIRIVRALGRNSNGKLSVMAFILYIVLRGQSVMAVFFVFFFFATSKSQQ
jgi:hypothetical protein